MTLDSTVFTVKCRGIEVKGDILIADPWKHCLLLSLYGSESHIKGVFANLVMYVDLKIVFPDGVVEVSKDYADTKLKLQKIGYGKYHGVIYSVEVKNLLVIFPGESLFEAYSRFLYERKIPVLKDWIPDLHELFVKTGRFIRLTAFGCEAYQRISTFSDDEACNFIISYIKRKKATQKAAKVA